MGVKPTSDSNVRLAMASQNNNTYSMSPNERNEASTGMNRDQQVAQEQELNSPNQDR